MKANPSVKNLMKILIGVAWIDGKIQPEERDYLHRVAKDKEIADDPEIKPLLHELRAVTPEECYAWVQEFLGDRPSPENCQQLIEAISGLIYSDGTVANEEARLLTNIQNLETESAEHLPLEGVLHSIRDLYQRWVSRLTP